MSNTITLTSGIGCPPISEQLRGHIDEKTGEQLDMVDKSIMRLYVLGYIPESTRDRCRKRLHAKCADAVRLYAQLKSQEGANDGS